jgi:hypothetical protein
MIRCLKENPRSVVPARSAAMVSTYLHALKAGVRSDSSSATTYTTTSEPTIVSLHRSRPRFVCKSDSSTTSPRVAAMRVVVNTVIVTTLIIFSAPQLVRVRRRPRLCLDSIAFPGDRAPRRSRSIPSGPRVFVTSRLVSSRLVVPLVFLHRRPRIFFATVQLPALWRPGRRGEERRTKRLEARSRLAGIPPRMRRWKKQPRRSLFFVFWIGVYVSIHSYAK